MKVTCMKLNGDLPHTDILLRLEYHLKAVMKENGFVSNAQIITRSSMKIGLHMCSFRIDPLVHGHNADIGYVGSRCKAGFKRTNIPTWKQREQFNYMVNDAFDYFEIAAQIWSGCFEIRNKTTGRINEWSSLNAYGGGDRLFEIKDIDEVT